MELDTAKLPTNIASKASLNGESAESLKRYSDRIHRFLERSEKSQQKLLAKIETLRLKAESEANNISPERQLNILLKVSDLVCKLESQRIKLLDLVKDSH